MGIICKETDRVPVCVICGPDCRRILHSRSAENSKTTRARQELMAKREDEAFPDPFETMETYNQEAASWLCAEMTPLR